MVTFNKDYNFRNEYPKYKTVGQKIISFFRSPKTLPKPKKQPRYKEKEFIIVFKRKYIKNYLMVVKGLRTYGEVAKYYGKTRQYMSMLDNQVVPASSEIIAMTAHLIGSISGNWHEPFEIICCGESIGLNHPKYNMAKHDGQVPYDSYSISYEVRKKDLQIEKQEKEGLCRV